MADARPRISDSGKTVSKGASVFPIEFACLARWEKPNVAKFGGEGAGEPSQWVSFGAPPFRKNVAEDGLSSLRSEKQSKK